MLTIFEQLLLAQVEKSKLDPNADASGEVKLLITIGLAHVYADRHSREINPYYPREFVEISFNKAAPPNLTPQELYRTEIYEELRNEANKLFRQATRNSHLQEGVEQVSKKLSTVHKALEDDAKRRGSPSRQIFWNIVGGGVVAGLAKLLERIWGQ